MSEKFNFIVIGAQKSGTTSLHHYLNENPKICLPKEKEAPFFSDDEIFRMGFDRYFEDFFPHWKNGQILGKVTPQYSCYPNVASRIKEHSPDVKIIYILRDPIARAVSHHRMCVKRGLEPRGVKQALTECLETGWTGKCETSAYLQWGKYSEVVSEYQKYFSLNNILLISSDELASNTDKAMEKIYSFLQIDHWPSNNYHKKFHLGGSRRRLPIIESIRKVRPFKWIWRAITSKRFRRQFNFWLDQANTKPETGHATELSEPLEKLLLEYFKSEYSIIDRLN